MILYKPQIRTTILIDLVRNSDRLKLIRHIGRCKIVDENGVSFACDETDSWGRTPLLWVSKSGKLEKVRLLLSLGATVDIRETHTNFRDTAASWAAYNGHEEILRLLLLYGADKYQITHNDKRTLLHWSLGQRKFCVFRLLIHIGCDFRTKNGWDKNVYDLTSHLPQYRSVIENYITQVHDIMCDVMELNGLDTAIAGLIVNYL